MKIVLSTMFVAAAMGADLISFTGNVTLKEPGQFRWAGMASVNFDAGFLDASAGAIFSSFSAKAEGDGGNDGTDSGSYMGSASSDGLVSLLYAGNDILNNQRVPPSNWMAYFSADASGKFDWASEMGKLAKTSGTADLSGVAGFMAHTYYDLQEIDAAGAVVGTYSLGGFGWTVVDVSNDNNLHQATLKSQTCILPGCHNFAKFNDFSVQVQFLGASVTGKLSSGAVVTPKNMESVITFENFPYADPANKLAMRVIVGFAKAAGSMKAALDGSVKRVDAGTTDQDAVFIDFNENVNVDGNSDGKVDLAATDFSAKVDGKIDGDIDASANALGASLKGALSGALEGSAEASMQMVKVTFPAGAKKITYDPSFGSGKGPEEEVSAAASNSITIVASLASVFLAAMLA